MDAAMPIFDRLGLIVILIVLTIAAFIVLYLIFTGK